jgi:hypothetical protein
MRKRIAQVTIAAIALAASLAGCENDLISSPPGSVALTLSAAPVAVPGETDCDISWSTNVPTKFIVEYGTSAGVYTMATVLSPTEATSHQATLGGLASGTAYYYRIKSYYRTYQEATTGAYTFATDPGTNQIAIATGPTVTRGETSLTIDWTTNYASASVIEYGTSAGTYTAALPLETSEATSHSRTISGLALNTAYYYRILSQTANPSIDGSISSEFSTSTLNRISITVGPSATPSTTSVTVTCTTNLIARSTLEWGTSTGVYTQSAAMDATETTAHSGSMTGLSMGTTYYCRIASQSTAYPSAVYSLEFTVETLPTMAQKLRGIWLVGGLSGSGATSTLAHATVVSSVDLYDPVTDTWFAGVTTLPVPVSFCAAESFAAGVSDHRIYVFGGFNSAGSTVNTVQYYTLETNTWNSASTTLPTVRANFSARRISGKIYLMGGTTGALCSTNWAGTNGTTEFVPGSTWTAKTAFGTAGFGRGMLVYNDTIYNFGGRTAAATIVATHDGFIQTNNAVTSGATEVVLSGNRVGMATAVYEPSGAPAQLIVVGGFSALTGTTGCSVLQATTANTAIATVQYLAYPFAAPITWTTGATGYPIANGFGSAVVYYSTSLSPNYRLYYFGGTQSVVASAASGLASARWTALGQAGSAWTDSWTATSAMPTGRYGFVAVTIQQ